MKLTFRKHEVKDLQQLEALVTEHADAIEPGCRIVAAGVNLGRSTVDLAGFDARRTPILVALGFTADDEMLFRMLEAYAWSLEYPESVRRLVGEGPVGWPPRIVFVAERVLEAFLRKVRLLKFPAVDCFEFRCVEVNGATGFYLDAVDWNRSDGTPQDAQARTPERPLAHATTLSEEPQAPALLIQPFAAPIMPDERPVGAARPERHERVTGLTNGQSGGADQLGSTPRWLELLTTPTETPGLKPVSALDATLTPPETSERRKIGASEPKTADEHGGKQRDALDGLDLPVNKEIAPTWRKFLERLTGGFDTLANSAVAEVGPAAAEGTQPEPVVLPPAAPAPAAFAASVAPGLHPAPAAQAGRNGSASGPHVANDKRGLLDGVQLPENGELAPQWRKFLDKTSIDEQKIAAVKEYFHREFPLCTIYDFFEFQRNAQVFQLQDNHGKVAQLTTISADFFEARRDGEIRPWLEKHKLAQAMRQAGQAGVFVSASGLQIEKR
jgi:hypothetical protein